MESRPGLFRQKKNKKSSLAQPQQKIVKELFPLPVFDGFIGFNCRTYAIASVMRWLYETKRITQAPFPARKKDFIDYTGLSLRKIAKNKYHSAVGEIYNIEDLAALAEENQDISAKYVTCSSENDYINLIIDAINANQAPVVFFDVCIQTGLPNKFNGKYEHAAVVVGYTIHPDKTVTFKVGQWETYYEFNAIDLYQSSAQLNVEHEPSSYFKVKSRSKRYNGRSAWVSSASEIQDNIDGSRVIGVKRATSPTTNGGYAKTVLVLQDEIRHELSLKNKRLRKSE